MSDQFVIDALNFVRNAGLLQDNISPSSFERLQSYLASVAGKVVYSVSGIFDEQGRPVLKIAVSGTLDLKCQRCLEKLEYSLNLETRLFLARNEEELLRYDEDIFIDAIPASHELDILALIEDEIILSLPVSPRHQNTACYMATRPGIHGISTREHPFTALTSLKRSH